MSCVSKAHPDVPSVVLDRVMKMVRTALLSFVTPLYAEQDNSVNTDAHCSTLHYSLEDCQVLGLLLLFELALPALDRVLSQGKLCLVDRDGQKLSLMVAAEGRA